MSRTLYRIPIFIPQSGCKHACSYCNQAAITGVAQSPPPDAVKNIVEQHLSTFKPGIKAEIAFFGGTFTALPLALQEAYLQQAARYIGEGCPVSGIRFSTRPDDILAECLPMYKNYGVKAIELGAQSLSEDVLQKAQRGHGLSEVEKASALILNEGFVLGLQMMIGLPGDSLERSLDTARRFIELGAKETRIYPTLVMKKTLLAEQYRRGEYRPLSLDEAVSWCAELMPIFEEVKVKILRVGLHPADEFNDTNCLLAGPYHPSFRALVESEIWGRIWRVEKFEASFTEGVVADGNSSRDSERANGGGHGERRHLKLWVPPTQVNSANGHHGENKRYLQTRFRKVTIYGDEVLQGRQYRYTLCS